MIALAKCVSPVLEQFSNTNHYFKYYFKITLKYFLIMSLFFMEL